MGNVLTRLIDFFTKQPKQDGPKVIMLQIDGLGHSQFKAALEKGSLPFMKSLIEKEGAVLKPMYSGMPSTTVAVQAELFHGVTEAVPAFEYIHRKTGKTCLFFLPDCAHELSETLKRRERGLLSSGSVYCSILTGGAANAKYCTELINLDSMLYTFDLLRLPPLLIVNAGKILRVAGLALVELGVALYDFVTGLFNRHSFFMELKFVPMRIGVCIVLRELGRFNVKRDIVLGVPIIYCNFMGYDEQAHRRGPSSAFAHWTLKGIDGVIRDICRTAKRYREDCLLVIYSDHGQEDALPYQRLTGRTIFEAVRDVLKQGKPAGGAYTEKKQRRSGQGALQPRNRPVFRQPIKGVVRRSLHRIANYFPRRKQRAVPQNHAVQTKAGEKRLPAVEEFANEIKIAASGPLGHIYLSDLPAEKDLEGYARQLVKESQIPLVLFRRGGKTLAVNSKGVFDLIKRPEQVLGLDYENPHQVAADLDRLCQSTDAGDLVISGWRPGNRPLTFAIENGAHGGPGTEETKSFVLTLPGMEFHSYRPRPLELRQAVLDRLDKADARSIDRFSSKRPAGRKYGPDKNQEAAHA